MCRFHLCCREELTLKFEQDSWFMGFLQMDMRKMMFHEFVLCKRAKNTMLNEV